MKLLLLLAALSSLAYCELINTVEYFCQVLYHCPQGTSSTKSCQEWVKLIAEATCSEPAQHSLLTLQNGKILYGLIQG